MGRYVLAFDRFDDDLSCSRRVACPKRGVRIVHLLDPGAERGLVVIGDVVDLHRGSLPIGRKAARLDDYHPDAKRLRFSSEHATEAINGELGGLIAGDTWRSADPPAD